MSRLHVNCGYSPAPHHLHTQEILKEMKKSDEYKYRVFMCRAPELAIYREIMKEKMRYDDTEIY